MAENVRGKIWLQRPEIMVTGNSSLTLAKEIKLKAKSAVTQYVF